MSFIYEPLVLPKSTQPAPAHKFKHCQKCDKPRPPEGGIEMSATRWICATCWARRALGKPWKTK